MKPMRRASSVWRYSAAAYAALLIVTGGLVAIGVPTWVPILLSLMPWLVYLTARLDDLIAGSLGVIGSLLVGLLTMMATTALRLPMLPTVVSLAVILGVCGTALSMSEGPIHRKREWGILAVWIPATLGGFVWLATMVGTLLMPGAARYSWVMLGDSANNVIFAREIIYRGGIGLGAGENPVPLPSAVMAIVMAAGRGSVANGDLTRHDIAAFDQVWTIFIIVSCVLAGAKAGAIVRSVTDRALVIGLVSAGASLLPLSWFFTGYPIEFGFFNTHLALPIVLAAFLAYLSADRRPAIALAVLAGASTLLLAVWSPLVLLPAALGFVVAVREWRSLIGARGPALTVLVVGIVQLLAYGLAVVLPSLLRNSGFLAAQGGTFSFPRWMMPSLAVAAVLLAVAAGFKRPKTIMLGVLAMSLGAGIGLSALLFVTRASPNPWTYYPLKFAWMSSTVLIVLIVGLAASVLVRYFSHLVVVLAGLVVIAAGTVGVLRWLPTTGLGYVWLDPIERILSGQVMGRGDEIAEKIFTLATPDQAHFLWHSGEEFEGSINFWVLQLWSDSIAGNTELRVAAYGLYDDGNIQDLCNIMTLMGGDVMVHTRITDLDMQLANACPDSGIVIVTGRLDRGDGP